MENNALEQFDLSRIRAETRHLAQVNNAVAFRNYAGQWIFIIATIACAEYIGSLWATLPAIAIIASRQVALIAMMHDALHYRLFSNRRWNDFAGEFFGTIPLLLDFRVLRANHLAHHENLGTDLDPDRPKVMAESDHGNRFQNFKAWPEHAWTRIVLMTRRTLMGTLLGLGTGRTSVTLRHRVLVALWTVAFAALFTAAGLWWIVLIYWVLPLFAIFPLLMYVRGQAEHIGVPATHDLNSSRFVLGHPAELFFFAPFAINYHLHHHLFPGVPHYNLPKLHERLMQDPVFRKEAHITRGYLSWILRGGLFHRDVPPDNEFMQGGAAK